MYAALQEKLEQIRGVWRFRWTAMLVAWMVCLIGWLFLLAFPDTYAAWAQVHIDPRTRLSLDTKGMGPDSNVVAEAEAVREALLGTPQLDKVARAAVPGYAMANPKRQQAMLELLRKRVAVESNEVGPRDQPADLYTITYTDRDLITAHRVVEELLQQFLGNLQGAAQQAAQQAQRFLEQQVATYKERLRAAEAKLADFKKRNAHLLPGATGDYATRRQAAKDQVEKLTEALQVAEEKRDALYQQLSSEAAAATAADIRALEVSLRDLRQRFTEKYPDVIAARRSLEELKARQQEEINAVGRGDPAAAASTCRGVNEANREHQGVCSQLRSTEVEVAMARREVEVQTARLAELDKAIDTAPQVEAEYVELNRDYETTRTEYNDLIKRLNSVDLSNQAERRGAVRFAVIQPPTGSDVPVSPDRPRLILLVLLAGLASGVAAAYLMNELRPVFYSGPQLAEITKLPVIAILGTTQPEQRMAEHRRAVWAYSAATVALMVLALITLLTQTPTSQFIHRLLA